MHCPHRQISIFAPANKNRVWPAREALFFYAGRIHPSLEHATFLTYYEGAASRHVRAEVYIYEYLSLSLSLYIYMYMYI